MGESTENEAECGAAEAVDGKVNCGNVSFDIRMKNNE